MRALSPNEKHSHLLHASIHPALLNSPAQDLAELGAILFDRPTFVDHLKTGNQPREFSVLLPSLDCERAPVAHKIDPFDPDATLVRATIIGLRRADILSDS